MQATRNFPRDLARAGNALTVAVKDLLSEWRHLRFLAPREKSSTHIHMEVIISLYRATEVWDFFKKLVTRLCKNQITLQIAVSH